MINRISHPIKKFIYHYESIFIQCVISFGLIISSFLIIMSILSNPFSKYDHHETINDICLSEDIDSIILNFDNQLGTYKSNKIYTYNDKYYWVVDTLGYNKTKEIKIKSVDGGFPLNVFLSDLTLCGLYIHPLSFLTLSEDNDFFLLGTDGNGHDLFSKILHNLMMTIKLSLWALTAFLTFGISIGVFLGYYKYRFPYTYSIINYLQKVIESVPVILWMIITINLVNIMLDQFIDWEWQVNFFMFGLYSSTALSKLLSEKFETYKSEDFIVALKLLGLSDFRIIVIHILKYQCLPIIILQSTYIIAQCIYLDMTLSVIEFSLGSTIGEIFRDIYYNKEFWGYEQITAITFILYFLLCTLFYFSNYYKEKMN